MLVCADVACVCPTRKCRQVAACINDHGLWLPTVADLQVDVVVLQVVVAEYLEREGVGIGRFDFRLVHEADGSPELDSLAD